MSSISGNGYGACWVRTESGYLLGLRLGNINRSIDVATWTDANDLALAFCRSIRQWQTVIRRREALAAGYAILGA